MPFRQGEIGEGEFPRKGVLLSTSFSGILLHFLQLECLSLSSVPKEEGLKEKGHLESQVRAAFWHLECSRTRLNHLVGAEHRLV